MDYDYLMQRMTEERQRAATSENQAVRDAHNALADRYQEEIERLRSDSGPELRLA